MSQDTLKQEAEWFLKNLQWQLEDLEFEERHRPEDKELRLYFDTADMYGAVVGMHAFYTAEGRFREDKFTSPQALIHCLAASRWLGPIHMLPPHQSEFLSLINIGFGVGEDRDPKGSALRFLRDVKALAVEGAEPPSLDDLSGTQLIKFVRDNAAARADLAINAFKFILSITGNWRSRLAVWRERGPLVISKEKFGNYGDLINSQEFQHLKYIFDEMRGDRSVNNFADAAAVMLLVGMVRDFNAGHGHVLPRFFVSTPLFREAVEKAKLSEELSYKDDEGRSVSILRDADYFIFKATILPPPEVTPPSQGEANFFNDSESLRNLRDRLADILKAREPMSAEGDAAEGDGDEGDESLSSELDRINIEFDRINIQDKKLRQVISEMRSFSFLESVWVPFSMENDVRRALAALGQAAGQLGDEKFQRGVDEAIKATKRELEESAREYERVSSLWNDLQVAAATKRKTAGDQDMRGLDAFRDLGLLRFDFPAAAHEPIRHVLDALLSTNVRKERAAIRKVITNFYAEGLDGESNVRRLAEASAVLWFFEMYDHLIDLLGSGGPLPHHSLTLVYAAALLERLDSEEKVGCARGVIDQYEALYNATTDAELRANMAVGLAYLYFHLWMGLNYDAAWRRQLFPMTAGGDGDEGQSLVDTAIDYAKRAYNLLPARNMSKKLYALNQYLYYLVEGGGDERHVEMLTAANTLILNSQRHAVWQYRFSDTLARYFHRQSLLAADEARWRECIKTAEEYSEEAQRWSFGDPVIKAYKNIILSAKISGFQGGVTAAQQP